MNTRMRLTRAHQGIATRSFSTVTDGGGKWSRAVERVARVNCLLAAIRQASRLGRDANGRAGIGKTRVAHSALWGRYRDRDPICLNRIRASGHVCRQPKGRTHERTRPEFAQTSLFPCNAGTIHTWATLVWSRSAKASRQALTQSIEPREWACLTAP